MSHHEENLACKTAGNGNNLVVLFVPPPEWNNQFTFRKVKRLYNSRDWHGMKCHFPNITVTTQIIRKCECVFMAAVRIQFNLHLAFYFDPKRLIEKNMNMRCRRATTIAWQFFAYDYACSRKCISLINGSQIGLPSVGLKSSHEGSHSLCSHKIRTNYLMRRLQT